MLSQADKFNIRRFKGAVVPAKRMTRDEALAVAVQRNSDRDGRKPGTFGSGKHKAVKDGPINAPFWQVIEIRA